METEGVEGARVLPPQRVQRAYTSDCLNVKTGDSVFLMARSRTFPAWLRNQCDHPEQSCLDHMQVRGRRASLYAGLRVHGPVRSPVTREAALSPAVLLAGTTSHGLSYQPHVWTTGLWALCVLLRGPCSLCISLPLSFQSGDSETVLTVTPGILWRESGPWAASVWLPPPREPLTTRVFPGSPSAPWRVHEPQAGSGHCEESVFVSFLWCVTVESS